MTRGRLRPLDRRTYKERGLDPEKVSLRDVSLLLGIYYGTVWRYMHELAEEGQIEVAREGGRYWLTSRAVEAIRQLHQNRKDRVDKRYQEEPTRRRLLPYVRQLAAKAEDLKQQALEILREMEKPEASSTWIASVPGVGLRLKSPIPVVVEPVGLGFLASAPDLGLDAQGRTRSKAVSALRYRIAADFFYLLGKSRDDTEEARLGELRQFLADEKERAALAEPKPPPKPHPRPAGIAGLWIDRGLTARAANALAFSGIATLKELRAAREECGLRLPHLGKKSRAEVEAFLHLHGDEA